MELPASFVGDEYETPPLQAMPRSGTAPASGEPAI